MEAGMPTIEQSLRQAIAHHQSGQLQEAERLYRAILRVRPDHPDVNDNLKALAMQAELVALFTNGRFTEAATLAQMMTERFPLNGFGWVMLGMLSRRAGQNEGALAFVQKGVKLSPDYAAAHNNLGIILCDFGRMEEAEASYRRALQIKPNFAEAHNNLGSVLRNLGRLDEAEACCRRALEIRPDNAEAHNNLGGILHNLNRLEEAEACCRRALQIKPDFAATLGVLNDIFRKQGLVPDYLAPEIFDYANGRLLKRYFPRESSTFIYVVEVAGTCNLRCPSCPVGNFPDANRPKGFMELDLFRDIVEKIKRDRVVEKPNVWLFNWGEPLLHPKLPEMISILKQNNFYVMISTNLNIKKNLEEIIRSNPDEIKISLSGYTQEFYSKTHVKGNIELVKENMKLIRSLINKFNVSTRVWVGHHLYRHNSHESDAVQNFCRTLGFTYNPIQAFYQPIEKMIDLIEGKCSAGETDVLNNLPVHPLDNLAKKRETINRDLDCELRFNMTTINYDGSVATCCGCYDYQNMLGVDFLDASQDEIQELKYRNPFCKKCYDYGLQYSQASDDV